MRCNMGWDLRRPACTASSARGRRSVHPAAACRLGPTGGLSHFGCTLTHGLRECLRAPPLAAIALLYWSRLAYQDEEGLGNEYVNISSALAMLRMDQ